MQVIRLLPLLNSTNRSHSRYGCPDSGPQIESPRVLKTLQR